MRCIEHCWLFRKQSIQSAFAGCALVDYLVACSWPCKYFWPRSFFEQGGLLRLFHKVVSTSLYLKEGNFATESRMRGCIPVGSQPRLRVHLLVEARKRAEWSANWR